MMGDKSLKEIRAGLCKHLGIEDKDLNAWMDLAFHRPRPRNRVSEGKFQALLQELEDAVSQPKKSPNRAAPKNKRSRVKRRTRTPNVT